MEPIEIRVDLSPAVTIAKGAGVEVKGRDRAELLKQRQNGPEGAIVVVEAEEHGPIIRLEEGIRGHEPVSGALEMLDHRAHRGPHLALDVVKIDRDLARQRSGQQVDVDATDDRLGPGDQGS